MVLCLRFILNVTGKMANSLEQNVLCALLKKSYLSFTSAKLNNHDVMTTTDVMLVKLMVTI